MGEFVSSEIGGNYLGVSSEIVGATSLNDRSTKKDLIDVTLLAGKS